MSRKKKLFNKNNARFIEANILNDMTFQMYEQLFERICLSMFEWVNLPPSMNQRFLEKTLYYNGMATLLKSDTLGFINTCACSSGKLNIYELPTKLNCYSLDFSEIRNLYTGLKNETAESDDCVLVLNNQDMLDTYSAMTLFAYNLYNADRIRDINITAQRTPYIILADDDNLLSLKNIYTKIEGNEPVVALNKKNLDSSEITVLKTEAPFVADKIQEQKKEILNEALTFLGINNIMLEKKERLVSDEANSNNEMINLNLQSFLIPRQEACEKFNELFGLEGENKISVRLRSDLKNIIKNELSNVKDFAQSDEGGEVNE